jgi:hypothetical protein
MKIYFTAAIYAKDKYGKYYEQIVNAIESLGHTVQHKHITDTNFDELKMLVSKQTIEEKDRFYKQVLKWINMSDIVVIEASFPSSLNIGHEITLSLEKGKPVIVLYKKGFDSIFLNGLHSDKLFLVEYTDENITETVKDSIDYAKDQSDTRFNFFLPPSLMSYMDWISEKRKIPRSVYLRELIERDRERNREFNEA